MRKEKPQNTGVNTGEFRTPEITEETAMNSSEAWFNGGLKG